MSSNPLHELAEAYGVLPMFHDLGGHEHWTNDETRRALLKAMGVSAETDNDTRISLEAIRSEQLGHIVPPEFVVTAGYGSTIPVFRPCAWILKDEKNQYLADGYAEAQVDLPALEVGVYHLNVEAEGETQIAIIPAAPVKAPMVDSLAARDRVWGVTAPLYGLRSSRNLGVGDYTDLASLAAMLGDRGASFLGINPIHSWGWSTSDIASPYSPSHRAFLNTLHIALDSIPGLDGNTSAIALMEEARGQLDTSDDLIDYQVVRARHQSLLRSLYETFREAASESAKAHFDEFVRTCDDELSRFAVFEALAVKNGENWESWPIALQDPASLPDDACSPNEIEFHVWLQWIASEQLRRIADSDTMPMGLYLDLAVGSRRNGAEAWMGQDCVAKGVSLGAPPDHLNPQGQNWQLTAFAPKLSALSGYRNFRSVLRQTMRAAGIIRIDHVLGLNRSFWIPDDGSPGAYIQQPFETLLALTAIEAHQANCVVVGEDLGLVPEGFREMLAARGIYGYSVLQYEREWDRSFRDPSHLRAHSLACFATHDTPTLHGYCAGRDIDWWQRLGWIDADTAIRQRDERKADVAALVPQGSDPGTAIHDRLARSPAAMTSVQLDDILAEEEAQNLPGTIDEHPNWRRIYSVPIEKLEANSALPDTADLMRASGRAHFYPEGEN